MKKNKLGHQSLGSFAAGLTCAGMLSMAAVQAQTGPPVADQAATGNDITVKETLEHSLLQYEQAIEGELYNEAADASKIYISALLNDPEHDRTEWGRALTRLGYAQRRAGEVEAAVENYMLAVDVIESESDRLDTRLAKPLHGLSRSLADAGDYRGAIKSYKRLLHVQQVNNGLHTLEQAQAVNDLSNIYYRLGDYNRANALQQSNVSIYSQNYPGDNLNKLPALLSQAEMYSKTGHLIDSQNSYHRIIAMIERGDSSQSLHLLPAIYQFCDLLRNYSIMDGNDGSYKARRFLRRAVYIAETHEDATNLDRADAYIAMGDFLSLETFDGRAAMRHYIDAWDQLSADPSLAEERDARFGEPTVLNASPSISSTSMRKLIMMSQTEDDDALGRLAIQYSVNAEGRTQDIEVLEGDPTGYWDPFVVNHVDGLIFRPGIVDGEPNEYSNRVYEIQYSFRDREKTDDLRQNSLSRQANYQTQ